MVGLAHSPWPLAPLLGWGILLSPLASALLIQLFGVHRKRLSAALAIAGLLIALCCTGWLFLAVLGGELAVPFQAAASWIALPGLTVQFGVLIDRLSLLMALVVTGVGSAIFIYSMGYMTEERAYSRYFGMLSLFAFSMLTIVLAGNWIQLFIGWELVGFCSYILIGHWYAKPAAAEAGKKAFMVNRVADFGFLLGILWLWAVSSPLLSERTVEFQALEERLPVLVDAGLLAAGILPLIGLLLFCGVVGKSAQFPLHVWLPDAMEGPTPVSALIHAATMVAAGVYLLCRTFWFFEGLPSVLTTIMWVGAATAFLSACLALVENDLKRILAYSTLSQLGYMVMALGLGGAVAGMYHLTTHAFFKALLFLAAGSVIHATHEQDIWKLGGLRRQMPWTALAFLVGALALGGFPGLSGFFSKDEILVLAHEHHAALYWLGTITAGLTAFYIARAWFVAFAGAAHLPAVPRSTGQAGGHGPACAAPLSAVPPLTGQAGSAAGRHESPPVMVGPLVFLAILSIAGGYLGIPQFLGEHAGALHWDVALASLAVVAAGLLLAWLMYSRRAISPQQVVHALALPYTFVQRRFFIDEFYAWYVREVQQRILAGSCALVERVVIIGLMVNGTAALTRGMGYVVRLAQTGKVQLYVLGVLVGVLWFLSWALFR